MVGFVKDSDNNYAGRHILVDFYGCKGDISMENILHVAETACKAAGATILFSHGHPFPDCIASSGVVVLAESHCTWHSWPEEDNFIAFDVFMCGDCNPLDTLPILQESMKPTHVIVKEERRGCMTVLPDYNI